MSLETAALIAYYWIGLGFIFMMLIGPMIQSSEDGR